MRRIRRILCWVCLAYVVLVVGAALYSSIRPERLACFQIVNIQDTEFDFGWLQESQWVAIGVLDCKADEGGLLNQAVSQGLLQHMLHNHGWEFCGTSADVGLAASWDTQLTRFRAEFPQHASAELDLYTIHTGLSHVLWCKAVVHRASGRVMVDMSGKW